MSINLQQYKDKLLFLPLGGANEIGINVNLYHYQGKWLMVDCGSGFADEHLPGVDMVVADLSFIEERRQDLLGIVLTHAHEDHLGAIQYLWNDLKCPIYATNFTKNFLKAKLSEYSFEQKMEINTIEPSKHLKLGPFSVEMIGLTHSAPEMHALMIRTAAGNILHTGDWKFDPEPIIGAASDAKALEKCGDEGVLALVCDSTNVFNEGTSGSEGDVRKSLVELIRTAPQMVVVTTFASNLARLDSLIHAAQQAGRRVCLTGRSLHRMLAAAQDSGYLEDIEPLVDERAISQYKRQDILVIATGCQGEAMAATAKLANNTHHSLQLAAGDTVIFSSKIIPGNEKNIFKLYNSFVKRNISVITEKDHFVHVSGHPAIDELEEMYRLVRPKVAVPVHGEPMHIYQHAKLARANGVKQAIEVENGSLVLLEEQNSQIIDRVKNGYIAVDGNYLLPEKSEIFKMRRRMRETGIVVVNIVLGKKLDLVCAPALAMPGVVDSIEDHEFIVQLEEEIIKTVKFARKNQHHNYDEIKVQVIKAVRRAIKREINKNPTIIVNISYI